MITTDKYEFSNVGLRELEQKEIWTLSWSCLAGFGEISIICRKDGSILIDSEGMSKDFVRAALCALVDFAQIK